MSDNIDNDDNYNDDNHNDNNYNDNKDDFIKAVLYIGGALVFVAGSICLAFLMFDGFGNILRSMRLPISQEPFGIDDLFGFFKK